MKIKHIWSILCSQMIVDSITNNVSLIGIIEEVGAEVRLQKNDLQNDLIMPLNYSLVTMWYKEKKDETNEINGQIRITLISPEAKEFKQEPVALHFPKGNRRLRTHVNIQGFPITASGDYVFRVEVREDEKDQFTTVSEFPIQVVINRKFEDSPELQ